MLKQTAASQLIGIFPINQHADGARSARTSVSIATPIHINPSGCRFPLLTLSACPSANAARRNIAVCVSERKESDNAGVLVMGAVWAISAIDQQARTGTN